MAIRDKDNGFKALQDRLENLDKGDGWTVVVGILEAGEVAKVNHQGKEESVTLADVAAFHEYGLGVPQRSFIGGWWDENSGMMQIRASRGVQKYLQGAKDKEQLMNELGAFSVGGIQQRISQGIDPPLEPSTIKAKGSSVPLIDTGQLRTGITFRIK